MPSETSFASNHHVDSSLGGSGQFARDDVPKYDKAVVVEVSFLVKG